MTLLPIFVRLWRSRLSRYSTIDQYFDDVLGVPVSRGYLSNGVEPTNNHSEQQVRHVVIDRRITQGTRRESGQRFNERMWTAIATCKKQQQNFFEYLNASIEAKLSGSAAPSPIH